ncbi:hypothetical protein A3749_02670 [Oleiphilus sp. HI0078]|nr:hypothetical protein A3749_02670 [Oleiphilus sp. HI0078]
MTNGQAQTVTSSIEPVQAPSLTINPERESIGKKLIFFAWAVEICAVIIGFAISIMQGISSFTEIENNRPQGLGFGDYTNVFIAMMPFLMVAIVEITKIPFVAATYKTSNSKWKFIFGTSLVFLAFITFESALNGFERNFHALIFSIDKHKKELVAVEEEIEPLEIRRTRLASLSSSQIEAEYSQRHAIISEERSRQAEVIQDRIQGLRAATQNEYIKGLSAQIEDRREQLKALRADRQKELDALIEASRQMTLNASSELDTQRRSLQQQLANEQAYLKELRVKREKKIADAGFFSENSVKKEQNALVETQEKKVEDLRLALNKLSDSGMKNSIVLASLLFLLLTSACTTRQLAEVSPLEEDVSKLEKLSPEEKQSKENETAEKKAKKESQAATKQIEPESPLQKQAEKASQKKARAAFR